MHGHIFSVMMVLAWISSQYFDYNVVENLSYFTKRASLAARILRQQQIKGSGVPDFSILENNVKLFFIEIKTKACISIADIVTGYNNQDTEEFTRIPIIKAIRQVFGYLGDGKLRYGVLSTYERTWFLYRPDSSPSSLLISDCVERTATDPTLLHCLAYMMTLPRGGNHFSRTPPPSPPPSSPSDDDHEPSQKDDYNRDPSYKPKYKT